RVSNGRAVGVVIGCVDVEVGRPTDAGGEIGQDGTRSVVRPVSVPDVVDVGRAQAQRPAMVVDSVCVGAAMGIGVAGLRSLAPAIDGWLQLFIGITRQDGARGGAGRTGCSNG